MIPSSSPMFQDPKFVKDREDFIGGVKGGWDAKRMERARPEALVHLRDAFELLETTLLADGREWVFKTEKPSLGDIEGESLEVANVGKACVDSSYSYLAIPLARRSRRRSPSGKHISNPISQGIRLDRAIPQSNSSCP